MPTSVGYWKTFHVPEKVLIMETTKFNGFLKKILTSKKVSLPEKMPLMVNPGLKQTAPDSLRSTSVWWPSWPYCMAGGVCVCLRVCVSVAVGVRQCRRSALFLAELLWVY